MINVPNLVTVTRTMVALVTLSLLWLPGDYYRFWAFFLTIAVICADRLDGYLANRLKQCTKFGATLDIAADRVVELSYWIAFACLAWVPVWVPMLFLVRGAFVDAIRSHYGQQGYTAFGEQTMMKAPIAKFLVASNFSRFSYAAAKALAFCLIIAAHIDSLNMPSLLDLSNFCLYFACVFCFIRGLPVLLEGSSLFAGNGTE